MPGKKRIKLYSI